MMKRLITVEVTHSGRDGGNRALELDILIHVRSPAKCSSSDRLSFDVDFFFFPQPTICLRDEMTMRRTDGCLRINLWMSRASH